MGGMTPKGYRIRQVRELHGWTQTELAAKIGLKQPAVAQFESGACEPSDETLRLIARHTGFTVAFFNVAPAAALPLGSLLYRGRAALTAREESQAHRLAELTYEMSEAMAAHTTQFSVRVPRLSEHPADAARITRASLGLSPDTPITQLMHALESAGVLVLALPEGARWDAFSAWAGDHRRPVIVLASNRPGDRTQWNLAHELGHLVAHQAPARRVPELEREANNFAAEFLLPEAAMRAELTPPFTLRNIARLKPRWRVAVQALVRRAHDLDLITDRQYRYLFQQIGAQGWRTREPAELDVPLHRPRALKKMAEVCYGLPIDVDRMARDFHLLPSFVRRVLANYSDGPPRMQRAAARGSVVSLGDRRQDRIAKTLSNEDETV